MARARCNISKGVEQKFRARRSEYERIQTLKKALDTWKGVTKPHDLRQIMTITAVEVEEFSRFRGQVVKRLEAELNTLIQEFEADE
jgi:arsenate reductase-like glutaredoxin family protein